MSRHQLLYVDNTGYFNKSVQISLKQRRYTRAKPGEDITLGEKGVCNNASYSLRNQFLYKKITLQKNDLQHTLASHKCASPYPKVETKSVIQPKQQNLQSKSIIICVLTGK